MTVKALRSVEECKAAAVWRIDQLCREHGLKKPKITFGLRGSVAAQAFITENRIDFNLVLFRENFEDGVRNSCAHEMAHLVAYEKGLKRGDFHGRIWKEVMIQFRAAPIPCHNLEVTQAMSRTGYFTYRCRCNSGNMVSPELHHQIQANQELFRCRKCRELPVYIPS